MRWHVLKTLWYKELLRHGANRGGILLVVLLMAASLLLSFFGDQDLQGGAMLSSVKHCYIDYWENDDFIKHLKKNQPTELASRIQFRHARSVPKKTNGDIFYHQNTGAIQVRNDKKPVETQPETAINGTNEKKDKSPRQIEVCFYEPGKGTLSSYEIWFWRETQKYQNEHNKTLSTFEAPQTNTQQIEFVSRYELLKGGLDPRSGFATALVVFGFFFICVYLMPAMSCEERERGVLLAQALSPASAKEILAAKFLFYPILALFLGCVLAGAYRPVVLITPYFWLALVGAVAGSTGVGLAIASLARTQRAASMGALAYMFVVTLYIFVCERTGLALFSHAALEFHTPRMIHAALADTVTLEHWGSVVAVLVLSGIWIWVAVYLFRKKGWQN